LIEKTIENAVQAERLLAQLFYEAAIQIHSTGRDKCGFVFLFHSIGRFFLAKHVEG